MFITMMNMFLSLDVVSLFTNVTMKKTVDIMLIMTKKLQPHLQKDL